MERNEGGATDAGRGQCAPFVNHRGRFREAILMSQQRSTIRSSQTACRAANAVAPTRIQPRTCRWLALALLAGGLALSIGPAIAVDGTWNTDTGAGNLNWSTAANWLGGVDIADGQGATANLTYNITANRTVVIDTSRTLGYLNIGDITTTSSSFTLNRSGTATLTFDNAGLNAQLNQVGTSNGDTIGTVIVLNDSLDINNQSTANKTLTISGAISAGTAGNKVISNVSAAPAR
jgi:hypothetical protein